MKVVMSDYPRPATAAEFHAAEQQIEALENERTIREAYIGKLERMLAEAMEFVGSGFHYDEGRYPEPNVCQQCHRKYGESATDKSYLTHDDDCPIGKLIADYETISPEQARDA